jgi:hypothetical protein
MYDPKHTVCEGRGCVWMRGWCACIAKKIQGLEGTICDAPAKLQPRRPPARPPKPARKPGEVLCRMGLYLKDPSFT